MLGSFVLAVMCAAPIKVAMMPLQAGEGVKVSLADSMTEALVAELRPKVTGELVTPRQLAAVLSVERQKQLMGCTDESCLVEIAGALSADEVVTACQKVLRTEYFEVNGHIQCPSCKDASLQQFAGGSSFARFSKAALFGLGATVVSAAAWIAIVKITGYELGIVAIGVGLLIGGAVRKGSGNRGGWPYQALAIFLTYTAMVAYYVPYVVEGLVSSQTEASAPATAGAATDSTDELAKDAEAEVAEGTPSAAALEEVAEPTAASQAVEPPAQASTGGTVAALAVFSFAVLAIAFVSPFMAGFENIMGIFILGFALYEAWKLNRRTPMNVAGPFPVASSSPRTETPSSSQSA
jgi:hypothetical protein